MNKNIIASITLAAFTGIAVPVSADTAPSHELQSVSISGHVLAHRDGKWQAAESGALSGTSHLRTGADGNALVSLSDGSSFRIAPNSQVDLDTRGAVVKLERGRLLGRAVTGLSVRTDRTTTRANQGEFVVLTTQAGTQMRVLSGNAKLTADRGTVVSDLDGNSRIVYPEQTGNPYYAGEVSALNDQWKGNWKGKGTGDRSNDSEEAVGGQQDVSPDTDVNRPIQRPTPPVNNNPPTTNNPPVNNNPPVTNNPPTQSTTVAGGGGGFPWVPVLIGAGAVGGIIALIVNNNNDDDEETIFVPSPSFP